MSRAAGAVRQKYRNPYAYGESADPSATPDTGYTYTNDVGGRTELMYMDDTGAEIQITKAGGLNVSASTSFPLLAPDGLVGAPSYSFSSSPTTGLYMGSAASPYMVTGGTAAMRWLAGAAGVVLVAGGGLVFSSSGVSATSGAAVFLQRDGNGVLSQRDAANAQTFAVHNTYTAGTPDYERLEMKFAANVATIDVTKSGTGAQRALNLAVGGNVIFNCSSSFLNTIGFSASTSGTGSINTMGAGFFSTVSSTITMLNFSPSFRDQGTNSTTVAQCVSFTPTINYTGASKTGKVVLAYFNPTLTSQPTGTNAGVSFSSAFTSSTFPAMRFFNTADEDTNWEDCQIGWSINSNAFAIRTNKGGTGTARVLDLYYHGVATAALRVPTGISGTMDMALSCSNGAVVNTARVRIASGSSTTATSGTHTTLNVADSYAPTSTSTMAVYGLSITPTINFSNGTPGAGYVYGLYINPLNTALPTGRSAGIALSSTASGLTGAIILNNQVDEQTNYEQFTMGFSSNVLVMNVTKGGTGTQRSWGFQVGGTQMMNLGSSGIGIGNTGDIIINRFGQAGSFGYLCTVSGTLTSSPATFGLHRISTTLAGAFTVTRLSAFEILNPAGAATITDMCIVRYDAAAGTHKAVDAGTTKTTPGTVNAWEKVDLNGTTHFRPLYTSKTT